MSRSSLVCLSLLISFRFSSQNRFQTLQQRNDIQQEEIFRLETGRENKLNTEEFIFVS